MSHSGPGTLKYASLKLPILPTFKGSFSKSETKNLVVIVQELPVSTPLTFLPLRTHDIYMTEYKVQIEVSITFTCQYKLNVCIY